MLKVWCFPDHRFMQMVTLLPQVEHFFALTADWAALSFAKEESSSYAPSIQANGMERIPTHGQDSQSEKEEDVLSFVPRRRGSRGSGSGSPALNAATRSRWKQQQQQQQDESGSSSAHLSSSSVVSDGATSASTAPTSVHAPSSSPLPEKRIRRPSPVEGSSKGGPLHRVLQSEADTTGLPIIASKKRASSFNEEKPSRDPSPAGGAGPSPARRASDLAEHFKGNAAAFVEATDILKRRREDAVAGLGSAILSSDSDNEGKSSKKL
jgi:hypothetical protein